MKMKKSKMMFIAAAVVFALGIILNTIGAITANTEAELMAHAQNSDFWWFVLAAIVIAFSGFMLRRKGQ